jgi:hypothetical protein
MVSQYAIARNANGSEHRWRTVVLFLRHEPLPAEAFAVFASALLSALAVPDSVSPICTLSLEEAHRLA